MLEQVPKLMCNNVIYVYIYAEAIHMASKRCNIFAVEKEDDLPNLQ